MVKPDWCPQDVWDAALNLDAGFFEGHRGLYVEDIASVILAAEQREREAILEIVSTAPLSNRADNPAISNKIMADWIEAAILSRSKPQ